MENSFSREWVDVHAPACLDDYVLAEQTKSWFRGMVDSGQLVSMTFAGTQGSGKTTLAKVLCREFDADVLFVPCATEGVVDTIRTKIEPFCEAMSLDGKKKIVVLDELDSSSQSGQNSFQMALRTLIEAAQSDTRFIATCNYAAKVIPAVLSRMPTVPIGFGKKDLLVHVKKILDAEKIEYSRDSLKAFVEDSFKLYPDVRRIVKYLQMSCVSGKLDPKLEAGQASVCESYVAELAKKAAGAKNLLDVRTEYLREKDKLGDFVEAGSKLFSYALDSELVVDPDGTLLLSDLLYKLSVVVDKESLFFGMLAAVAKFGKKAANG